MKTGDGRRTDLWCVAGYAALALVPILPAAVRGRVPSGSDISNVFHPLRTWTHQARIEGWFPAWNPWIGCGVPHASDPQVAWWYPPNWLIDRLDPGVAGAVEIALHAALAAVAIHVLVRCLGASCLAAAVAATAFQFSAAFTNEMQAASNMRSAAWGAVLLAGLALLRSRAPRIGFAVTACATGCVALAGHPQFGVVMIPLAAAILLAPLGGGFTPVLRTIPVAAASVAVGALLASVAVLPLAEFAELTQRRYAAREVAWDQELRDLGGWLVPWTAWGSARTLGLPVIALGVIGLFARPRVGIPCAAAGLLALAAMFGAANPVGALISGLPVVRSFHYPGRFLLCIVAALAVLAATGMHAWTTAFSPVRARAAVGVVAALAVVAAATAFGRATAADWARVALGAAGLVVITLGPHAFRFAPLLVLAASASELIVQFGPRYSGPERSAAPAGMRSGPTHLKIVPRDAGAPGCRLLSSPVPPHGHNRSMPAQVENVNAHLSMRLMRGLQFCHLANEGTLLSPELLGQQLYGAGPRWDAPARFLDMMAVKWATGFRKTPGPGWRAAGPLVFERDCAHRTVRVVSRACAVTSLEAAAARLVDPGFDPADTVVIETRSEPASLAAAGTASRSVDRVVRSGSGLRISLSPGDGGWLVTAYNYLPGMNCTVDGAPAEVLPANVFAMAVRLPARSREIEITYTPPGLRAGMLLSLLGVVLFVAGIVWLRPRVSAARE